MKQAQAENNKNFNKSKHVFFIGSGFDDTSTGGQIYNSRVVDHLRSCLDHFTAIDCAWLPFWDNFKLDLKTAYHLSKQQTTSVVILDESRHQRMALTTLTCLLHPKINMVLMMHQLAYTRRENKLHRAITRFIDGCLIKYSSASISAGFYVAQLARELVGAKYHDKIKLVLATPQAQPEITHNKQKFHACFVGAVVESKGIAYLIEAISKLSEPLKSQMRIAIAGPRLDDAFLAQSKQQVKSLKLEQVITFCGQQNWEQLKALYAQSELFLFPSLSENMPMSLMEAMATGITPICFDVSAMPYFIEHEKSGYLAKLKSATDFAKAIESFYALTDEQRQSMANNASHAVQPYIKSWQTLTEEFEAVVRSV